MKKLLSIFAKAKSNDLFRQYKKAHVLWYAILLTLILGTSEKSLEITRLAVNRKRLAKLRKKYKAYISDFKNRNKSNKTRKSCGKVWVFWDQGIEKAPSVVQKCYASLQKNLANKNITLLTNKNYKEYVDFPDYIQEKIDNGIISKTHMSDLLRLELLIKYGGTWIDATVFCSGKNIPEYMLNSDLFTFQCLKPGLVGHSNVLSSWFIHAKTGSNILLLTRELLYKYWIDNDELVDYFLLHDFFQLSIEAFPSEWDKVVPFSNAVPHMLLLRLFDKYNESIWKSIRSQTPFHKLTYKFNEKASLNTRTYFRRIIKP